LLLRGNAVDYEENFYLWTEGQARLLRSGEFSRGFLSEP